MESELDRLRRMLAQERERREEEQRRREEEQRRREEAEIIAESARPSTITEYLQRCHELSLAIDVIHDATLTTQGEPTRPAGRVFPNRILPWTDFASQQEHVWEQLSYSSSFHLRNVFPSSHQLDYVRSLLSPISSEIGLRNFVRDTVENAVQKLVEEVYNDEVLRARLKLRGSVTFESHTNLGQSTTSSVDQAWEQMSSSGPVSSTGSNTTDHAGTSYRGKSRGSQGKEQKKVFRRTKGKGQSADQFCIYRSEDGRAVPIVAIEYKAPHKVTRDEVLVGLDSEILPSRDVINQERSDIAFLSKSLMAAVVTQAFSYMIGKGIQNGYLCTGEAYVFLHVPDDPTMIYYHVCIPNWDLIPDDENRLHRTAVAQVFAFILNALSVKPPPQSWYDAAMNLEVWTVEYIDILKRIPETDRKKERLPSGYKPQRWKGFHRSPIRTRSQCLPTRPPRRPDDGSSDDDGTPDPSTPTPNRSTRSPAEAGAGRVSGRRAAQDAGVSSDTQTKITSEQVRLPIEIRPYCTHQCLLGLAYGGSLDSQCPNIRDHGKKHIKKDCFLRLLREQLAVDRGRDADCQTLCRHGSRGATFKVRLSSHGYTVLAKAMEEKDIRHLKHENQVYDHLRPIQGIHVPVCLGYIKLKRPQYYNFGVYLHMLVLSWAGHAIVNYPRSDQHLDLDRKGIEALQALHRLSVLHKDPETRNMLFNEIDGRLMLVDFERSDIQRRQPLGVITPNRKRKRQRKDCNGHEMSDFNRELQCAKASLSRSLPR